MSQGLGAAYSKQWRELNPEKVSEYTHSIRGRYTQLKRGAKRTGVSMDISLAEYASMLAQTFCTYCGGSLSLTGYSIDRLDHLKGYTKGNIVVCCGVKDGSRQKSCNMRKGHLECIGFRYPRTVELLRELLEDSHG